MRDKRCFKCGETKPLSEFYAHSGMADGHLGKCKACTRIDVRTTRASRPEYYRAYDSMRAQLPHRKAQNRTVTAAWRTQHPERRAAQVALNNAVRDGRVIPWPACAVAECDKRPVAHHPDYDRPLDVVWLCQTHHKQAHAIVERRAA